MTKTMPYGGMHICGKTVKKSKETITIFGRALIPEVGVGAG